MVDQRASEQNSDCLDSINAQLSDLDIRVEIQTLEYFPAVLAQQVRMARQIAEQSGAEHVFWFDLSLSEQIFLYISEPGGGRILVRQIEGQDRIERVEALAVIVRGIVRALGEGGQIGIEVPSPTPLAEPVTPSPPAPSPPQPSDSDPLAPRLGLRLSYQAEFFGSQAILQHGIGPTVSIRIVDSFQVFATYHVLWPIQISTEVVEATINRHPVALGVRYQLWWEQLGLAIHLSGLLDCVTRKTRSVSPELSASQDRTACLGGVGTGLSLTYRVFSRFSLFLQAEAQFFIRRIEYLLDLSDGDSVVLSTWLVRPSLGFGIAVDLF